MPIAQAIGPELASQDVEYARLPQQDPRQVDAWRMRSRLVLQGRDDAPAVSDGPSSGGIAPQHLRSRQTQGIRCEYVAFELVARQAAARITAL